MNSKQLYWGDQLVLMVVVVCCACVGGATVQEVSVCKYRNTAMQAWGLLAHVVCVTKVGGGRAQPSAKEHQPCCAPLLCPRPSRPPSKPRTPALAALPPSSNFLPNPSPPPHTHTPQVIKQATYERLFSLCKGAWHWSVIAPHLEAATLAGVQAFMQQMLAKCVWLYRKEKKEMLREQ